MDAYSRFNFEFQVRRITYIASQGVAMAELHDGAIIDGKPVGFNMGY